MFPSSVKCSLIQSMTQGIGIAAVDQEGERVVRALPATVPSPDPVGGATTTGDLATVTVRDRP